MEEGTDILIDQEPEVGEDVEPYEMTEEVVDALIDRLEAEGYEEGINFLIDIDGCVICNADMRFLLSEGYPLKVVSDEED